MQFWLKNQEKRNMAEYQQSQDFMVPEVSLNVDAHAGRVTTASGVASEHTLSVWRSRSLGWVSATFRVLGQAQGQQQATQGSTDRKSAAQLHRARGPVKGLRNLSDSLSSRVRDGITPLHGGRRRQGNDWEMKSRLCLNWSLIFWLLHQPCQGTVSPKVQILES